MEDYITGLKTLLYLQVISHCITLTCTYSCRHECMCVCVIDYRLLMRWHSGMDSVYQLLNTRRGRLYIIAKIQRCYWIGPPPALLNFILLACFQNMPACTSRRFRRNGLVASYKKIDFKLLKEFPPETIVHHINPLNQYQLSK